MRVSLFHIMIVLEEGNLPHLRCSQCYILVTLQALNVRHLDTAQFTKGAERKRRRMVEEEIRYSVERSFQAYGILLEMVAWFK